MLPFKKFKSPVWPKSGTLTTLNIGKDVKQKKLSYVPGGNGKWHGHFGREFGDSLQNETYSYHVIQ